MKNQRAISLISLVITIVVIVIISAITLYTGLNMLEDARYKEATDILGTVYTAITAREKEIVVNINGEDAILSDVENILSTDLVYFTEENFIIMGLQDLAGESPMRQISIEKSTNTSIVGQTTITYILKTPRVSGEGYYSIEKVNTIAKRGFSGEIEYDIQKGVNRPQLAPNMQPIAYNENGIVHNVEEPYNEDWYMYNTTAPVWANMRYDGEEYVWIPRYAYKIQEYYINSGESRVPQKAVDILYLQGISNKTADGRKLPDGYTVHPAFKMGSKSIAGIWVAKGITGTTDSINIAYNSTADICSITNNNDDLVVTSHLLKNVEWGVIAYLAQSLNMPKENSIPSNASGIMDLDSKQYISAYLSSGTTVSTNGADIIGGNADIYRVQSGVSVYEKNKSKQGDAMYETSKATSSTETKTWHGGTGEILSAENPFITRGNENAVSLFDYRVSNGIEQNVSYKAVIVFSGSFNEGDTIDEETTLNAGVYKTINETYEGDPAGTYNNPIIPKGFRAIDTRVGTNESIWVIENNIVRDWNKGLVIEDKNGNQFVWVPCYYNSAVNGIPQYNRYLFYGDSATAQNASAIDLCVENAEQQSIIESIKRYGGFYIARYEAGNNGGRCTIQRDLNLYNNVTKEEALELSSGLYNSDNYGACSTLASSYAIDTVLRWMQMDGVNVTSNVGTWGNAGAVTTTGSSDTYVAKNIYDLSGNALEWTTELTEAGREVTRGGTSVSTTSNRSAHNRGDFANNISFRPVLYIMDIEQNGKNEIEYTRTMYGSRAEETPSSLNPIIPRGFKAINVPGAYWVDENEDGVVDDYNAGLVIEDARTESVIKNQFVWIPCLDTSGITEEPSILASINKYGGFYVARYEAGAANGSLDLQLMSNGNTEAPHEEYTAWSNNTTLVSIKDALTWNYVTRDKAIELSYEMYGSSSYGAISKLISDGVWDKIDNWLDIYYSNYQTKSIDDIGVGKYEWMATSTSTLKYGSSLKSNSFTEVQTYTLANANLSFRPVLYVMDVGYGGQVASNVTMSGARTGVYNNPIIPKGFRLVNTEIARWSDVNDDGFIEDYDNGLVIEDENGNQFVWVPVSNISQYSRRDFSAATPILKIKADNINGAIGEDESASIVDSIQANGGFYVSRYEIGAGSGEKDIAELNGSNTAPMEEYSAWTEATPVSQKGVPVYDYTTKAKAASIAYNMYNSSSYGVGSRLISSYAWDTVCAWIGKDVKNSVTWGYYSNSNPTLTTSSASYLQTGYQRLWSAKNIYDFAGNAAELTSEFANYPVIRSANFASIGSGSTNGASIRNLPNNSLYVSGNTGFRTMLYIESQVEEEKTVSVPNQPKLTSRNDSGKTCWWSLD